MSKVLTPGHGFIADSPFLWRERWSGLSFQSQERRELARGLALGFAGAAHDGRVSGYILGLRHSSEAQKRSVCRPSGHLSELFGVFFCLFVFLSACLLWSYLLQRHVTCVFITRLTRSTEMPSVSYKGQNEVLVHKILHSPGPVDMTPSPVSSDGQC